MFQYWKQTCNYHCNNLPLLSVIMTVWRVSSAGPPQWVDWLAPRWEITFKCLSQGHSDASPHRKSSRDPKDRYRTYNIGFKRRKLRPYK